MSYQPIHCNLYDCFEIACLYHYTLKIKLLDGETMMGVAQNMRIKNKQEFLLIRTEDDKLQEFRLDNIKSITAIDKNAEFNTVKINEVLH